MDGHFLKLLHVTPSQVLTKIIQPERFELEAILSSLGNDDVREFCSVIVISALPMMFC